MPLSLPQNDGPGALASERRRFTVEEYHSLGEAGILHEDDRVELIDGDILLMSPIGPAHILCVMRLDRMLHRRLVLGTYDQLYVSVQSPIRLGEHDEPEPDLALVRFRPNQTDMPAADQTLLIIEVADTSLDYDREKLARYAAAGIAVAWIVALRDERVEVYRHPDANGYRERTLAIRGDRIHLPEVPGFGSFSVDDIFGPQPEP